jgi:hypothetical protein
LRERQNLLFHRIYEQKYDEWFWPWRKVREDQDLLEPVYSRIVEIMYEQLQYLICQSAIAELPQRINPNDFAETRFYSLSSFDLFPFRLPKSIENIFKRELVQEEIRALILEELCILTPKLEQRHAELLVEIREFKPDSEISYRNLHYLPIFFSFRNRNVETIQREALSHELLLKKLYQDTNSIVEQIQQRVLDRLYKIALEQFNKWGNTQLRIVELCHQFNLCEQPEKSSCITSKTVRHQYQKLVHKPLLKHQFKYSTR